MATASAVTIVGPADNGRAMTLDEFIDAEFEEGYRYELARGVLEVTFVPNDPQGDVVCNLIRAIARYDAQFPQAIRRFGEASGFRLWLPGMDSGRNPDVAVVLRGTPPDERGNRPPSLVMEVVSEGAEARRRDYQEKREEYLAYGLREYWIVDPSERKVIVLTRRGDVWSERIFGDGQEAAGLVLPGFVVAVTELWGAEDQNDESDQETD